MKNFDLSFYNGKKVLITGHTGFKGTGLCRLLLDAGAEVTGYSLEPPTEPSIFNLTDMGNQMHSVIGDIRDLDKLMEVFREQSRRLCFIWQRSRSCGSLTKILYILTRQM